VAVDSPDNLSITAGRVYLIDVSFDKPVSSEILAKLPGVSRFETEQAIEISDRLRAQQAMAGAGSPGGMGGGGGPGRMQAPAVNGLPPRLSPTGVSSKQSPGIGKGKMADTEAGASKRPGNRFRLYTENTTLLVSSLVDFSRANSVTMNILNIRPPSLEDAFVRLTGEAKNE
jgi:hypothetical protein